MPKHVKARAAQDQQEERKVRKLAGSHHAPADWKYHAQMVLLSWVGKTLTEQERSRILALAKQEPPGHLSARADGTMVARDEEGSAQWSLNASLGRKVQPNGRRDQGSDRRAMVRA